MAGTVIPFPGHSPSDKAVKALSQAADRHISAQARLAATQTKLAAIQARNRAEGVPEAQVGPKGGRFYVNPKTGEKVYLSK